MDKLIGALSQFASDIKTLEGDIDRIKVEGFDKQDISKSSLQKQAPLRGSIEEAKTAQTENKNVQFIIDQINTIVGKL